jgi:hypothetical protein
MIWRSAGICSPSQFSITPAPCFSIIVTPVPHRLAIVVRATPA